MISSSKLIMGFDLHQSYPTANETYVVAYGSFPDLRRGPSRSSQSRLRADQHGDGPVALEADGRCLGSIDLMAQHPNPARTKIESTTAGEQHVIPGAEKVSDAEVAKRKAREPLKLKVEQKPADEGLFGDEANQTDLVDLAGKR